MRDSKVAGLPRHIPDLAALRGCITACRAIGGDRFGGVTYLKVPVDAAHKLQLRSGSSRG